MRTLLDRHIARNFALRNRFFRFSAESRETGLCSNKPLHKSTRPVMAIGRGKHLKTYLPKLVQDSLGEQLLLPGLYRPALSELQRRFENRQAIVHWFVSILNILKPLHDQRVSSLSSLSASIRSVVATLKLCVFREEL